MKKSYKLVDLNDPYARLSIIIVAAMYLWLLVLLFFF